MTPTPDLEGHPRFWAVARRPVLPAATVGWAVVSVLVVALVLRARRRRH